MVEIETLGLAYYRSVVIDKCGSIQAKNTIEIKFGHLNIS